MARADGHAEGPAAGGRGQWEGTFGEFTYGKRWVLSSGFPDDPHRASLNGQLVSPEGLSGRISSGAAPLQPATEPMVFRASGLQRTRKKFWQAISNRIFVRWRLLGLSWAGPGLLQEPQEASRRPQETPRRPPGGARRTPGGARRPPGGARRSPGGPREGPQRRQEGPRRPPGRPRAAKRLKKLIFGPLRSAEPRKTRWFLSRPFRKNMVLGRPKHRKIHGFACAKRKIPRFGCVYEATLSAKPSVFEQFWCKSTVGATLKATRH